jgi:hypothetical protein
MRQILHTLDNNFAGAETPQSGCAVRQSGRSVATTKNAAPLEARAREKKKKVLVCFLRM